MALYDNAAPQPYPPAYPQTAPYPTGEERMGAHEIIKILRRRRSVIATTVVLLTGLSTALAYGLAPQYTASSSVAVDPSAARVVNSEAVIEEQAQDKSVIETEIKLLQSRSFARSVIEQTRAARRSRVQHRAAAPAEPARSPAADGDAVVAGGVAGSERSGDALGHRADRRRRARPGGRACADARADCRPLPRPAARRAGGRGGGGLDRVHLAGCGQGRPDRQCGRRAVCRPAARGQAVGGGAQRGLAERAARPAARRSARIRECHRRPIAPTTS